LFIEVKKLKIKKYKFNNIVNFINPNFYY